MRGAVKLQRSVEERDRMVEQFLPLVRYVVARLPVTMPASLDQDDFYSVGVIGLMPRRGAAFGADLQRFKSDPQLQAVFLTTAHSGQGLNLVEASHVILVEPLANPALEHQAVSRVDRGG